MAQSVREVMTKDPVTLSVDTSVVDAARRMKEVDIGDVIVLDESDQICGIVTDRDIVVRAIAEQNDPTTTNIGDICSRDVTTVSPDDSVGDVVRLMREKAIRRVPVVEGGKPVGVVSIGDLAVARDQESALADISAADPNE